MESRDPSDHLNRYVTERLPRLVPGLFGDVPDLPDFTVDQRFEALQAPTYGM